MTEKAINVMRAQLRAQSVTYTEEERTVRGSESELNTPGISRHHQAKRFANISERK